MQILELATQTELENLCDLGEYKDLFPTYEIGVAQGCCLSPLIGNVILSEFDNKMNGRNIVCLRYIDDFLILGPDRKSVYKAFKNAQIILDTLGLSAYDPDLHMDKAQCGLVKTGFEFLGCDIHPPQFIRPNKKSRNRLIEKIQDILNESRKAMSNESIRDIKYYSLIKTLYTVNNVIKGWGEQYSFCDDFNTMDGIDNKIDQLLQSYLLFFRDRRNSINKDAKNNRMRLLGIHVLADTRLRPIK